MMWWCPKYQPDEHVHYGRLSALWCRLNLSQRLRVLWRNKTRWARISTYTHRIGPLIILVLFAGVASAADPLTVGVLAASAADLATTQWVFATGAPGVHDIQPLVNGPTSATVVKFAATAGVLLLDRKFQKDGHKRASKALKIATIVVWGSCAAWNIRQAQRHGDGR